ncbi:ATP-binding response regulator [Chitinophaga alhagiae]|nr:ATP-binding protein [Chitinophaga alhagiae]
MKLFQPLAEIISFGSQNLAEEQQQRIRIINSLSLVTALLAISMGPVFYFITGKLQILVPALIEGLSFFFVIWLNHKRRYEAASLCMMCFQAVWAVYFGVLLGTVIEITLVLLFMISATFLVYKKKRSILICFCVTAGGLLVTEAFYFAGWVRPFVFEHNTTFIIRWCYILVILSLNTICILFYKKMTNGLMLTLKARTLELEKANQSRKVFLQETSHELRNPLNAIFGIVQLMQMDLKSGKISATLPSLVDSLYSASFNMREIINNVLELSRIEAGQLDEVRYRKMDVRKTLCNIANIYEYVANTKSVHIDLIFSEALPEKVMTDETKFSQIINNLLMNAIKFTRPKSDIAIRAGVQGMEWYVSVTDQGGGIEQDKLVRIFEPFVGEKSSFIEGTGLGLHISKHFAELLEGNITVECRENTSTTFTVYFPLSGSDTTHPQASPARPHERKFSSKTVLVIEDDKMNQVILKNFLLNSGVRVLTANNGVEGLTMAREQAPDLIILDSHMPKMNGRETLLHLKNDPGLRRIPVIIASGDAFTETAAGFMREGACDYVTKPIEFTALRLVLEKHLTGAESD